MPDLTFYRQKRYDGGIRTGVELDGLTLSRHFVSPRGERDPSLLWFVDLRCSGSGIPDDPAAAFDWLQEHAAVIREGFRRYSDKLEVGADVDRYPLEWTDFGEAIPGVEMKIACSAVRRVEAREIAVVIAEIGVRWQEFLDQLAIDQEVEGSR